MDAIFGITYTVGLIGAGCAALVAFEGIFDYEYKHSKKFKKWIDSI